MIGFRSPIELVVLLALIGAGSASLFLAMAMDIWLVATQQSLEHESHYPPIATTVMRPQNTAQIGGTQNTPLSHFSETLQRPLFERKRRPWAPALEPVAIQVPKPEPVEQQQVPDFPVGAQLVGIHLSHDEKRALLREADQNDGYWLSIGGEFAGWIVESIDSNQVVFKNDGRIKRLQLYVEK